MNHEVDRNLMINSLAQKLTVANIENAELSAYAQELQQELQKVNDELNEYKMKEMEQE